MTDGLTGEGRLRPGTAVFDLDGTLAETAPDLIGAANDLLALRDLPSIDPVAARTMAGRGGKALIGLGFERAGQPLDAAGVDALFAEYLALYQARIDRETHLYDGVASGLERLAAAGWALSVCTNKPEALAVDLLGRLGVAERFGAIIGADTLPVRKPDPRPVWEAIDRVAPTRERAVLIGDSITDRDAARNAEIPIILVSYGYAREPIASLKPDAVIDRFDALDAALAAVVGPVP